MSLRMVRIGEPRSPIIDEDDAYVPLLVDWVPLGAVSPVYYRVQGGEREGGYIEVKIEPLTGEIVGLVVVDNPLRQADLPEGSTIVDNQVSGAVFVDMAKWCPTPDNVPRKEAIYDEGQALGVAEGEQSTYYELDDRAACRWIMTERVGFGVAADNSVVGILLIRN